MPNLLIITGMSALVTLMSPVASGAQRPVQRPVPPTDSIIQWFRDHARAPGTPETVKSAWAISIVIGADSVSAAKLDELLDGLAGLALRDPDSNVRIGAVITLGAAGAPPRSLRNGVVERLAGIYEASRDRGVRDAIVGRLGWSQANKAAAARVLERVASEPSDLDPGAEVTLSQMAIGYLSILGEEGRASLQRLHATNAVSNPNARRSLEALAKNSFRPIR